MMSVKSILVNIIAFVFHFIPRNKHLWLTGKPSAWYEDFTPPKFFDNSKYFYLYLVNNTKEKVYWVSSSNEEIELLKSMNLPVVKYKSLKGVLLILRAKFFFHHYGINQIDPRLQYGATHIDFWHGTPLKKIRYDVVPKEEDKRSKLVKFLDRDSVEYVSSTSKYLSDIILAHAFDVPDSQMINFGYPRTDVLKLSKEETYSFCQKYSKELISCFDEINNYSKILLYMPTWRDDDPYYFEKAAINFKRLNKELIQKNYLLYIKLHPLTKNVEFSQYSNIRQLNNDVDVYPFLNYTDFLITDYSSIYFDFLLLNKEIIFIPYDYDNYINNRSLYFNYDEVTPGKKYYSFDSFIDDISNIEQLDFSEERKNLADKIIDDYHFDACEKTYIFFRKK